MTGYGLVMLAVTEFVVTILVFLFAGRWADGHWTANQDSGGRYMISATILGFVLGCIRMYMRLKGVMGADGAGKDDR